MSRRRLALYALGVLMLAVVVANWTYGRLPGTPPAHGRFATVADLRIRYLETPGAEPAVLLLHGLPGTAEDFEAVTPLLAGRRTIAIDRPGFGYSSGGYVPFDRQLRAIRELLARLHASRPVVVGHSYGGTIALGLAESEPRAVSGLVLVDAAAACTRNGSFDRIQAHALKLLQLPVLRQLADATFAQLMLKASAEPMEGDAFAPARVNTRHRRRVLAVNLDHANLEAYAGEVLAANGTIERVNRGLAALRTPAVVIQGRSDRLVKPACGRALAAAIPGARLEMVAGGHMAPYTHPWAVASAVKSVLAALGR